MSYRIDRLLVPTNDTQTASAEFQIPRNGKVLGVKWDDPDYFSVFILRHLGTPDGEF